MAVGGIRSKLKQAEWVARWLVVGFALGLPLAALGTLALDRSQNSVDVHVRMAEDGGWLPGDLNAVAGEPLNLRLVSDDVMHGFAIGQMDTPALDLPPGQVVKTTLTFERPGTYTYYCTRWCGLGHWRMRGTITVTGEPADVTEPQEPPLYVRLGLDLDAPHPAEFVPDGRPKSVDGAEWSGLLPPGFQAQAAYEAASPAAVWQQLRAAPATRALSSAQVWDLVAWVWRSNTTTTDLDEGRALYAANCAACHGEQGAGDGVFAATLEQQGQTSLEHGIQAPADFTDAKQMLGASSALLHGKIIRGGMGTGMPYWGPILTERQIWTLIDYVWSFQFEYGEEDR
jgi:cytochrome c oxidase subunit 2